MHVGYEMIRRGGQDRTGFQPSASRLAPPIPQSSKREHLALAHLETKGLLGFRGAQPFIEGIGGNQASLALQGLLESRFTRRSLGSRIDHPSANGQVFGPIRHEAPSHQRGTAYWHIRILTYYWNLLSGCNVVAALPLRIGILRVEVLGESLSVSRKSVTSAHSLLIIALMFKSSGLVLIA